MLSSQRAYVDSSEERDITRWVITQRSESFQSHLLDQILIFFNYFESIELSWFRTTITSLKVCEIISAQKSIRARKDADSWKIEQFQLSIFSISFAESNLRIFPKFLSRWTDFNRLYNLHQQKFFVREHLVEVRDWWSIDWELMTSLVIDDLATREFLWVINSDDSENHVENKR